MRSLCGLTQKDRILLNAKKSCQSSVDLRGQYLSVLPCCVHQKPLLNALKYLELSYNDFTEIPREICTLGNLQELYIQYNRVKSIPNDLRNLVKLQRLGLAHNQVQSVPSCFYKLLNLQWLNLSGNEISVLPPALLQLSKLTTLFVLCNPITNVPRNVYVQGLHAMREYFHIEITDTEADSTSKSMSNVDFMKKGLCNSNDVKQDLLPDKAPWKEVFHDRHVQLVAQVQQSQKAELQLIKDLEEKLRLSQQLRKLNIDYLKKQHFQKKFHSRSRRISNFSFDSGIRDQSSQPSEYESSSFLAGCHDDDDDDDDDDDNSNGSLISPVSSVCADYSESTGDDFGDLELPLPSRRHITHGEICVIIPECNLSGHFQSEFYLEIMKDFSFEPPVRSREVVASEVLMMEPHGALFYKSDPAIISLPYDVKVSCKDQIVCWCSNTGIGDQPRWQAMDKSCYTVYDNHVEIRAEHFSLFAVVASKQYPSAQRLIKKGIGGCLYVDEVPGVEVNFPHTSLLYDIEASIRVLYSDNPYDVDHSDPMAYALAAPVVEVGPHGCQFDLSSHDMVTVRLPLPNGKEIMEMCGDSQLTFWCSSTLEDEPLNWKKFTPKTVHIDTDDENLCSVYFSVEHFTFFRVLWDVLDAILYEAKLGASHYLPVFQFYVSCQALMSESEDGVRFGLCISCSRFGKPLEGIGNFPIPIGNHPPKMIHTGPILISIISGLFEADSAAGQESLTHSENFTGRQIVVQFICKFTGEPPAYGSFGKVEILQPTSQDVLFSFNLDKPRDTVPFNNSHAWDVHLSRELAALVTISTQRDMGDEVWEEIAHALRYTQAEITKIAASPDPMTELLANYKRRGGQPHEFITAMYSIGQYRTSAHNNKSTAGTVGSSQGSNSPCTSDPKMCPCTKKGVRKRKLPDVSLEDKFFEVTGKVLGKWKELGRLLKMNESKLTEIELNYKQDGVREQAYQMLLAWRDNSDPHNCTLTSLSGALCKMGMGYVARQSCMAEMG